MSAEPPKDAQLVRSALGGDRGSFEQIVRRYQTLVCSVTYSGTGDLALSEDLAQYTFLTAWRTLAKLREPANLRARLCGIARRLAANARRVNRGARVTVPLAADTAGEDSVGPSERAIRREEEALVWETLSQLPSHYREPLVLFYRQEQSVRRVAEDLGLTEQAVRQRLSRGRRLLSERLASLVETTLEGSKPSGAFLVGVMAALAALTPQAVAAGVIASAGKGSSVSKAALAGGTFAALLGPILGLLGAWLGVRAGAREAKSPRERRFVYLVALAMFGYIALLNVFIAAAYLLPFLVSMSATLIVLALLSLGYVAGLTWLAVWANRRQRQIRIETETELSPEAELEQLTLRNMARALAIGVFASVFWILLMSAFNGDWIVALVILGTAMFFYAFGLWAAQRKPRSFYRFSLAVTVGLAVLNLLIVNLRWRLWMQALLPHAESSDLLSPPLLALNLLLIGVFVLVLVSLRFKDRHLRGGA